MQVYKLYEDEYALYPWLEVEFTYLKERRPRRDAVVKVLRLNVYMGQKVIKLAFRLLCIASSFLCQVCKLYSCRGLKFRAASLMRPRPTV